MPKTYVCPIHEDQVLYKENADSIPPDVVKLTLPELPRECLKCHISYYKWECEPHET